MQVDGQERSQSTYTEEMFSHLEEMCGHIMERVEAWHRGGTLYSDASYNVDDEIMTIETRSRYGSVYELRATIKQSEVPILLFYYESTDFCNLIEQLQRFSASYPGATFERFIQVMINPVRALMSKAKLERKAAKLIITLSRKDKQ